MEPVPARTSRPRWEENPSTSSGRTDRNPSPALSLKGRGDKKRTYGRMETTGAGPRCEKMSVAETAKVINGWGQTPRKNVPARLMKMTAFNGVGTRIGEGSRGSLMYIFFTT